ncbi:preprotein translocase subunit SecG [Thiorhodospira sibirica]|uniref:preprotein translocase subunit SecG n=1 Tax=Thiorhodospira sibirica TaxID=154347 RepID=UPI00022C17A4|nr:preprotein translocase subunit SecG [Thiorhodospira sibirica]
MFYGILLIVQVVLAISLIVLVLLQHGKGADAGAAFGSGSSATVFGARGAANFLSRSTAIIATLFFLNSMTLAYMVSNPREAPSVVDLIEIPPQQQFITIPEPQALPEEPSGPVPGDLPLE